MLKHYLRNHPDCNLVDYLVEGYTKGFSLGIEREPKPREPCKNSQAVQQSPEIAQKLVDEEVSKGHIIGPFDTPPIPGLVYSPINIVRKTIQINLD